MDEKPASTPSLPPLPEAVQPLVRQLESGEFLGASRNLRQINDLFCAITEAWSTPSPQNLVDTLMGTGDYFIATRGRNTPAIANGVRLVLKGLQTIPSPTVESVRQFMLARRLDYNAQSLRNIQLMAEYGANLLAGCRVILPFDYSSTMMAILKQMADQGNRVRLIVPESRVLDGGRPIVREATACGHSVVYILDMAFSHYLHELHAVLIGAESILANGDCRNTIGSFPIAVLARELQVPFYVATELIKIDPRSFEGFRKPILENDYSRILNYPDSFEHPELISVSAPDLDNVSGSLISAYITPQGVMLPGHIRREAQDFLQSIT
jgi:ribose 1,5-bisphosphate isomerase